MYKYTRDTSKLISQFISMEMSTNTGGIIPLDSASFQLQNTVYINCHYLVQCIFASSCKNMSRMACYTHYCGNTLPPNCAHIQCLVSINIEKNPILHSGFQW